MESNLDYISKNNTKLEKNLSRDTLIKRAINMAIATAFVITILKIYALYQTHSLSVMSSLLDSVLDISASFVNYLVIRGATKPADENYRFGYNKIEDLAVFAQAFFFLGAGVWSIVAVIYKFYDGYDIQEPTLGLSFIALITLLNLTLLIYQRHVIKVTKSHLIATDYAHYVTDLSSNLGMMVSLYFYNIKIIDQIVSFGIGAFIIYSAIKLIRTAWSGLIDEEINKEDTDKIIILLKSIPGVLGVHEFKTRKAGGKRFIQLHLEMDGNWPLYKANELTHEVSDKIADLFEEETDIIIHQDPFINKKEYDFKPF